MQNSLIFLLLFLSALSFSDCDIEDGGQHKHPEIRGHWWCPEKKKIDEENPETENKPDIISSPSFLPDVPKKPPIYSHREIIEMHPIQLKKLYDEQLNWAMYTREVEDVLYYLKVLDAGRKKTAGFSAVSDFIGMKYPEMDSAGAYQTTIDGIKINDIEVNREIGQILFQYRNKYGLGLFVQSGCEYCVVAKNVMADFQSKTGWSVHIMDISKESGYKKTFNISMTPALVLIERNSKQYWPVIRGVHSLEYVTNRIYSLIRVINNEIKPSQFHVLPSQKDGFFRSRKNIGLNLLLILLRLFFSILNSKLTIGFQIFLLIRYRIIHPV